MRIGRRTLRADPTATGDSASLLRGGPLEPGEQRTGELRFELKRADVEALVREDGELELAVVPASEATPERSRRLGVVRLTAPNAPVRPLLRQSEDSGDSADDAASTPTPGETTPKD